MDPQAGEVGSIDGAGMRLGHQMELQSCQCQR